MEKIRIVIVEDEFAIAEDIRQRLGRSGYHVLSVFDRAEEAIPFIRKSNPDILLVDIRLSGPMDGIEMVQNLSGEFLVPVIYITANSDTATYEKAKLTNPNAFLVKPFSHANLAAAIDLALYNFGGSKQPANISRTPPTPPTVGIPFLLHQHLFVRVNGKYKKVLGDDLLFVEAEGSYISIHTETGQYTLSHNLAKFQKKTPLPFLVRVHRSYVINLNKVDAFEESFLFIRSHKIPISDRYRESFLTRVHLL